MSTQRTVDATGLFHEAIHLIDRLRAEVANLTEENERLKQHVKDLDHDLNGTIEDCNKHHGGAE
jgi:FtsZ-binding cell division protein ZapB